MGQGFPGLNSIFRTAEALKKQWFYKMPKEIVCQ